MLRLPGDVPRQKTNTVDLARQRRVVCAGVRRRPGGTSRNSHLGRSDAWSGAFRYPDVRAARSFLVELHGRNSWNSVGFAGGRDPPTKRPDFGKNAETRARPGTQDGVVDRRATRDERIPDNSRTAAALRDSAEAAPRTTRTPMPDRRSDDEDPPPRRRWKIEQIDVNCERKHPLLPPPSELVRQVTIKGTITHYSTGVAGTPRRTRRSSAVAARLRPESAASRAPESSTPPGSPRREGRDGRI